MALLSLLTAAFVGAVVFGLLAFADKGVDVQHSVTTRVDYEIERDPDVPDLPFPDNPDPSQCGIPTRWGESDNRAWLTGVWQGELIEKDVLLYDSHLRTKVVGSAPSGSEVKVVLFQDNPVLDYYFVKAGPSEGWVPGPFLSFDPVT